MLSLAEGLGGVEWAQLGCFKPGQCSVPGQRGALVGSCPEELLYCLVRWVGQQMNPCPQPLLGAKVGVSSCLGAGGDFTADIWVLGLQR